MKLCLLFAFSLTLVVGRKVRSFDENEMLSRIVNGYQNKPGEVPYIVWLDLHSSNGETYGCGGSIIDHEWILTAAHCTEDIDSVTISYGATWRTLPQSNITVNRSNIYEHESFNFPPYANDVALIRTPYVNFTNLVDKIDLPTEPEYQNNSFAGTRVITSGWGLTWKESPHTNTLQSIDTEVIENELCSKFYEAVIDSTLCTAAFCEWKSACYGDSGGPLVLSKGDTEDGKPRLIGVGSFGECSPLVPNAYGRVTKFLKWIKQISGVGN